jgi:hypothetical protein
VTKRRTKKQKKDPKYPFLVSWEGTSTNQSQESTVKGQNKTSVKANPKNSGQSKNAYLLEKGANLASVRHDIIKSLIIASFILGLEVVIYLSLQ